MGTKQQSLLAQSVIAVQILFTIGWIAAGFVQGEGYSIARHDISDLGAMTAHTPWVWMVPMGTTGVITICFAIGALYPILKKSGVRRPMGAWLVAFSLMGLDNVSDIFFRLDCRAVDPGCTPEIAAASVQGTIHMIVGMLSALITVLTPFVLSRHMRLLDAWKDLSSKTVIFGICFLIAGVGYIVSEGSYGHGYIQRLMCLMLSFGMIVLARRVYKIAT